MDLSHPYRVISQPLDGAALSVLAGSTRPLTGREVARLAPEGSQPGIAEALARLTKSGLVERFAVGNSYLHSLNRDHLAAPAAIALATLRQALIEKISGTLAEWEIRGRHASLFGSAARGDGDLESDVDILVVRPPSVEEDNEIWVGQIEALADAVRQWSGNNASISVISNLELNQHETIPPIVETIQKEGITLFGEPVSSITEGWNR